VISLRRFSVALLAAALSSQAHAAIEIAGQSVVTLASDSQTRGGGVGAGVEVGIPLVSRLLATRTSLLGRARICGLVGAGLAGSLELGVDLRSPVFGRFEPELGLHVLILGGALIRSIDSDGRLAGNPVALTSVFSPLRFRLDDGWINILGVRVGPTLARTGTPPFVLSLTLFEIGRVFGDGAPTRQPAE
jgi:hypothetical protein